MRRTAVVVAALAAGTLAVAAHAYFTTAKSTTQAISAVPDFLPPVSSGSTAVGSDGTVGAVTPGQQYRIYAQVADQGNPPSGVKTVTADLSSVSGAGVTATLSPGSFTVGSATYNYASANQTASASLSPSSTYPYSLAMTDQLGQAATANYTVRTQAPETGCAASALSTANGNGGTAKKVDAGDTITFKFTKPIDTTSIISWWTGGGVGITVLITDKGSNDELTVIDQSTGRATPLGTIAMKGDFAHQDVRWGGVIQLQSPDTVVVQPTSLYGGTGTSVVWPDKTAMTWTPAAGLRDTSGNPCSTTSVTQSPAVYNF